MAKFLRLIQNEWMKIWRKKSSWIMAGLVVAVTVVIGLVFHFNEDLNSNHANWKEQSQLKVNQSEQMLKESKFPEADRYQIESDMLINQYRLQEDLPPVQSETFWWFIRELSPIMSFITLFTVIIGSGILATEFQKGTIKLLMIRPIQRWKILLSKYTTTMLYGLSLIVVLLISGVLIGALLFPFEQVVSLRVEAGEVIEQSILRELLLIFGNALINLVMMTTLAFMLGALFRSSSLAVGLSIFLLFTGPQVVFLLAGYDWAKYILFAHTDLTQYMRHAPMIEGMTLSFSVVMLLIYFVGFHLIGFLSFQKRDIAV